MSRDIRIKTRRDLLNLTILESMDRAGVETTWRNRLYFLRKMRDELLMRVSPWSENELKTAKEVIVMINDLKTISRSNI